MNTPTASIVVIMLIALVVGVLYLRHAAKVSPSIMRQGEEMTVATYGTPEHLEKSQILFYKDFSIQLTGADQYTPDQNESVSFTKHRYSVTGNDKASQVVTVISGQLPPEPTTFTVNGLKFTLYTYLGPDQKRLASDQVIVTRE